MIESDQNAQETPNKMKRLRTIIFVLFLAVMSLSRLASLSPETVETLYSRGIYPDISLILNTMSGGATFSLFELLCITVIISVPVCLVAGIVRLVRSKERLRTVLKVTVNAAAVIAGFFIWFMLGWGFNYQRQPFSVIAGYSVSEPAPEELEAVCGRLAGMVNRSYNDVEKGPGGLMTIAEPALTAVVEAEATYQKLADELPIRKGYYGKPKGLLLSVLFSYSGISGIYGPFTGEANYNREIPVSQLPFVICHEMAHQRGFSREDEANFIAYLACMRSQSPELRFSGALMAYLYAMSALYRVLPESHEGIRQKIAPGVKAELAAITGFWERYEGPAQKASAAVNNQYLKANGQNEGIASYGRMVDLLIGEYRGMSE